MCIVVAVNIEDIESSVSGLLFGVDDEAVFVIAGGSGGLVCGSSDVKVRALTRVTLSSNV